MQRAVAQVMLDLRVLQKGAWPLTHKIQSLSLDIHSPLCFFHLQSLDSTNLCDKTLENGKQVLRRQQRNVMRISRLTARQEVFCKSCYGKAFGPKGYGFGGGAGILQMTGWSPCKNIP